MYAGQVRCDSFLLNKFMIGNDEMYAVKVDDSYFKAPNTILECQSTRSSSNELVRTRHFVRDVRKCILYIREIFTLNQSSLWHICFKMNWIIIIIEKLKMVFQCTEFIAFPWFLTRSLFLWNKVVSKKVRYHSLDNIY